MPRCFSISIQSEVTLRCSPLAFTAPACWIAPPYSNSFSVRVVLPASGWEMIAKLRRLATASARDKPAASSLELMPEAGPAAAGPEDAGLGETLVMVSACQAGAGVWPAEAAQQLGAEGQVLLMAEGLLLQLAHPRWDAGVEGLGEQLPRFR